ncbi:MAG: nucleoside kinase [Muribaculaceae bacterium]|nr:nucleoside kinase [Muribaculaceae bacterium]
MDIFITNIGESVKARGGETLKDLLRKIDGRLPFVPVCARVNNKDEDLSYPIFAPKQVEFLPVTRAEGLRCYVRSLCMVLYRAVTHLWPAARLRLRNAVSRGYYCTVAGVDLPADAAAQIKQEMKRIIAADIPIVRSERPTEEAAQLFSAQGLDEKVRLLEGLGELYTVVYTLDGLSDTCIGPMAISTGMLGVFDFVDYEDGFLLLPPSAEDATQPATLLPQPKLFKAFRDYQLFNHIVGISGVADVRAMVARKESAMMVNVAEALSSKYIRGIADSVTERFRQGGAKVVLIAGPSSSGKTTFTKRLAIELLTNLIKPVMISLDDYFVDRHHTPVDADGELDYESLYALDLDLFNAHLVALTHGEEIELPTYNFEKGEREYRGRRIHLEPDAILLIEGIHGLNPELTSRLEEKMKYRIYVSALTTISVDEHNWVSTTDTRLLRRIIRDYKYRGTSPLSTIKRWPSVRRGEEKWIFPYQENADSMFNSSLLFELSVIRDEAERVLRSVPRSYPEYATAHRLRQLLGLFPPVSSHLIPPTSLLREFLGGSSFHY